MMLILLYVVLCFFFFKQKTAYEMRISEWSSDVCSSNLGSQVGIEYFPTKIADLAGFLTDSLPPGHAFAGVRATPEAPRTPDIWLLGSSDYSAAYAAHFGLAFSFAHFISPQGGERVMQAYRNAFKPSALLAKPLGNIGVFVICDATEAIGRA